jgi:hypothetical protein
MQAQTWLFGVPLTLGVILVLCSALGAAELEAGADLLEVEGADQGLLAWLGLGRVPALIVIMFLLLIFGGVGLLLCTPLSAAFGTQAGFFATLPVASLSAFYGTSFGTRGLARILPRTETYAPNSQDLVGRQGRVSLCIDADSCIVRVTDAAGAQHRLRCRVVNTAVAAGDNVLLLECRAREYLVRRIS